MNDPDAKWGRRVLRFRSGLLGGLAALTPSATVFTDAPSLGVLAGACGAAFLLGIGALRQGRGDSARPWVLAAAVLLGAVLAPSLVARPGWSFVLAVSVGGVLAWRQRPLRSGGMEVADPDDLPVWGALWPAAMAVLMVSLQRTPSTVVVLSATATALFGALLSGQALLRREVRPVGRLAFWAVMVLGAVLAPDTGVRCLLLGVAALAALVRREGEVPFGHVFEVILGRPALMVTFSFAATIAVGTLLLALPVSTDTALPLSALDAFFTAVSATCVTGLAVVDTPTTFSFFGEAVLLVLIQIGGLGIMTFSTAALFALGRRMSLRHERALPDLLVSWEGSDPAQAVRHILRVTVVTEALAALILSARFATAYEEPLGTAIWRGLFTAISAFCNAGFALQSDSLMGYQDDALVLMVVGALIFVASLGPVVVVRTLSSERSAQPGVPLMLSVSAALLVVGTVIFAALEWNGVLSPLGVTDRLTNAFFQSSTLRTAGFNSVDFAATAPVTQVFMLVFMFIGGAPGSTAGGVKTTTIAVIVLAVIATLRQRPVLVRRRRVTDRTLSRAIAIFFLGGASILALWFSLLLTQDVAPLPALFEAVSALGTVGVSVGVTAELDEVGKILVALGMFAGRLGPITVLLLFASGAPPPRWQYPETQLPVG